MCYYGQIVYMFNKNDLKNIEELNSPDEYFPMDGSLSLEIPYNILIFHRSSVENMQHIRTAKYDYHGRFVLIVCLKSSGSIVIENSIFRIHPNEAILIFPYQPHHFLDFDSRDISWLFITFEANNSVCARKIKNSLIAMNGDASDILKSLIANYMQMEELETYRNDSVILLLSLFIVTLSAIDVTSQYRPKRELEMGSISSINRVNEYILKNVNKPIIIKELAEYVAISESHLRRVYKNEMGITIHTHVNRIKINHATKLLIQTKSNISEIADYCGFNTLYSFSRAFKHATDMSPTQYRLWHSRKIPEYDI